MRGDALLEDGRQLQDATKHAAAQALGGDVAKEAFDPIEPGRRRRGEVHMKVRMRAKPRPDLGVLVGNGVADETQPFVPRRFPVDLAEEGQPLGVVAAFLALTDDLAIHRA